LKFSHGQLQGTTFFESMPPLKASGGKVQVLLSLWLRSLENSDRSFVVGGDDRNIVFDITGNNAKATFFER
jgi:hypothetical protein